MQPTSDAQLLRDYAERGTEAAFAEIVTRHTDLVYSAALRQVYSPDLARDVTQGVFTDLARKARTVSANLSPEASLVGWLYRGTRFAARDLYRNETRRTQRERQAMEQLHPTLETPPDWEHLRPVLDDAMSELDDTDRDAVLLRYFKNHDLRTVGANLGISDDAAQKRVSRAVERLRDFFAKRGVTVGASGLAVVISANAVQAAPVGLAVTISAAATLAGTTLTTTATVTATKAIAMTALQKTIVTATIAVLAGVGIYEARQASQLRGQVQTLQQQQAGQIQQLQRERDDATNRLASLTDAIESKALDNSELLKLRGKVTRLQAAAQELAQLKTGNYKTANDAFGATTDAWGKRANSIKQWFEQNPDKSIPELQLLTDADWLFEASRNPQIATNRSQGNDFNMIAYNLRDTAKKRFAAFLGHAFSNYIAANEGALPDDLTQLLPYFAPAGDTSVFARSVDASILQRYELLRHGKVSDLPRGEPIVREKAPADDQIDALLSVMVGSFSMQSTGKVTDMMAQGQSFSWSHEDNERIKPFLK